MDKQTGQLRSTYDILKDLAEVYPTLTANQRQYTAEAIAGKRQVNVLQALLSNWSSVNEAVKNASDSVGSASQEQQAYLDSIEGKINQLHSAWSELSNSTISSDLIKGTVDLGTALLKLTKDIGLVNVALGAFTVVIGMKGGVNSLLLTFSARLTGATLKVKTLEEQERLAELQTRALASATQGVVVTLALWIGSKILEYIDKVNVTIEEQREIVENLQTEIDGLRSEYEKLSSQDNLTEKEQGRLKILENELYLKQKLFEIEQKRQFDREFTSGSGADDVTTSDMFVTGENGKDFINVDDSIRKFEELQQTIKDTERQLATTFDATELDTLKQKLSESEDELVKIQGDLTWVAKRFEEAQESGYDFDGRMKGMGEAVEDFLKHYREIVTVAIENQQAMEDSANGGANSIMSVTEIMDSLSESTNLVSEAYKEMSKSGQLSLDTVMEIINAGGELLDILEVQDDQYRINMDTLEGLFEQDKAIAIERVKNAIAQTKAQIASVKAELEAQTVAQEASIATLKTNQSVAKSNLEVAQSFVKSLGVQSIALGAFGSKLASESVGAGNASAKQTKEAQAKLKDLEQQLKKYEVQLKVLEGNSLPSYSGALDDASSSSDKLKSQTDELNDALEEQEEILDKLVEKYDNTKDAIIEMIDAEIEALEKANDMLGSFDADNSLANKYNIFKDYLLKGLEEEMDGIEKAGEAEKKYWQDKIDALKAEQESNERNKQLEEARLKIAEAQDALDKAQLARNQLQKNTRVYKEGTGWTWDFDPSAVKKADEDIKDSQDKVQEAVDSLTELQNKFLQEDIINRYQEQIEAIEQQTQAQIDAIQKQMDALDELASSWGNNNAEILDEILSQRDAQQWLADYQRASDTERIAMLEGFSSSYKTNVDDVIAKNQEEIANLETLRDNFEQKYDDMKQQLEGFVVDEQFLQDFETASYAERQAMLESFTLAFETEYTKQKEIVDSLAQEVQRLAQLSNEASRSASNISDSVSQAEEDARRLQNIRDSIFEVDNPTLPGYKGNSGYKQSSTSGTVWKYANGGLIEPLQTHTGLDRSSGNWFDGSMNKPELVLNDAQSGNILGALASTNAGKLYNIANNPMIPNVNNTTNSDTTTIGSVNVYPQKGDDFERVIRQARQMTQTKNR